MKFVDKNLAIKLYEKGFKEPCFGWYYVEKNDKEVNLNINLGTYEDCLYSNNWDELLDFNITDRVDAPTIEQTLKWLREEKDIMVFPVYSKNTSRWYCEIINADSLESEKLMFPDSYEDCCIEGIKYAINNLI